MPKYIEQIVDVKGDANCGFRAVFGLLGKGKEDHQLVFHQLIQEMTTHMNSYIKLYGEKENYDVILNVLIPCVSHSTPFKKLMSFPEMGHLIASAYDRVCIDLTQYSLLETFFPLQSRQTTSKSIQTDHMYWLALKNTIFCSSLFETGLSYTKDITRVDDTFHTRC